MKTLPNRLKPFTAAQYIRECDARRNTAACRRIDLAESLFRGFCFVLMGIATATVVAGLIHLVILFNA